MPRKTPSYKGLSPATKAASRVGRSNSARNTTPERLLRSALWSRGIRFRVHYERIPGKPDIAIVSRKVAIFCDGDFWHGRDWVARREKLSRGANPAYWVAKIERNIERDREINQRLHELGWTVLRIWEADVRADPEGIANRLLQMLTVPTLRPLAPYFLADYLRDVSG